MTKYIIEILYPVVLLDYPPENLTAMAAFVGSAASVPVQKNKLVISKQLGTPVLAASNKRVVFSHGVSSLRMGANAVAIPGFVKAPGADLSPLHADAMIASEVSKIMKQKKIEKPVIIGVAADSGCGKSTFLRRVLNIFGAEVSKAHTPQGDFITVICLDDYHYHDRKGRKVANVTALDERANNFELMAAQVKALKEGKAIMKPIYNHDTGEHDPSELIEPNHLIVIEGLHPIYDARVFDMCDLSVYMDVADEVKLSWKIQRDMAERGHTLDNILASIEARKPDFAKFVDPQKKKADIVLNILPTKLVPDDKENKYLRVQMIQREVCNAFSKVSIFDEGSTIDWVPCGRKLACSYPGIKFHYGPDVYHGEEVSILEMDGVVEKLDEMIYVESHLNNTATKFYGELTQQLLKNPNAPGTSNGTGLFQTLIALKMREVYEKKTGRVVIPGQPMN